MMRCMRNMKVASAAMAPSLAKGTSLQVDQVYDEQTRPRRWDVIVFAVPSAEGLGQKLGKARVSKTEPGARAGVADILNAAASVFEKKQGLVRPHMFFVKRILGLPGECIRFEQSRVLCNGQELAIPEALRRNYKFKDFSKYRFGAEEYTVPEDSVFVMSDNPAKGVDSRHIGVIPLDFVVGRVAVG
jgi:signal peptidase I